VSVFFFLKDCKPTHMASKLLFFVSFSFLITCILAASVPPTIPANIAGCNGLTTSNHAHYVCVKITDPFPNPYTQYTISFFPTPAGTVVTVGPVNSTTLFIGGLNPGTQYSFSVVSSTGPPGVGINGPPSAAALITTRAADVRQGGSNPADISNVACTGFVNNATGRTSIRCTWTNPSPVPIKVTCKGFCIGGTDLRPNQLPRLNHNHNLHAESVKNGATQCVFAVNRHPAVCHLIVRARLSFTNGPPKTNKKANPRRGAIHGVFLVNV